MSSFRQGPSVHPDDALAVVLRLGALVVAAFVLSVLVNVFAGGLLFVTGLTLFATYAATHAATQPLRPSGRVAAPSSPRKRPAPAAARGSRR